MDTGGDDQVLDALRFSVLACRLQHTVKPKQQQATLLRVGVENVVVAVPTWCGLWFACTSFYPWYIWYSCTVGWADLRAIAFRDPQQALFLSSTPW